MATSSGDPGGKQLMPRAKVIDGIKAETPNVMQSLHVKETTATSEMHPHMHSPSQEHAIYNVCIGRVFWTEEQKEISCHLQLTSHSYSTVCTRWFEVMQADCVLINALC